MMVSIFAFKFIASLNFDSHCAPEDHDDRDLRGSGRRNLCRTIDLLAQLKYNDKRI